MLAKHISKPKVVEQILKELLAPTKPYQIGVERDMAYQAIVYAKELRDRYTVLQLLWDLGELERFADVVIAEYYN